MLANKHSAFASLQKEILQLAGFKNIHNTLIDSKLWPISESFPNRSFPVGAVHEFLVPEAGADAATNGFIGGLLSSLMGNSGAVLWISNSRTVFPPALINLGLRSDRFVFVDLRRDKDVIWAMDEALKCASLSAVVGEVHDLNFTESRRLQLAVEQSEVTGFVVRNNSKSPVTTACISRWKITSLPSEPIENLPGIGYPKWKVELLRIRNGKPGKWEVEFKNNRFYVLNDQSSQAVTPYQKIQLAG